MPSSLEINVNARLRDGYSNNSIVTDADTDVLDSQITQISNDFAETYYFDNEQQEELEMLVAKCMKLGELYERKKWQAAKAQAVPEGFVLMPLEIDDFDHPITKALEKGIVKDLSASVIYKAMIEAQEPTND